LAPALAAACSNILGIEERTYQQPLCDAYCADVMDVCKAPFEIYASRETCLGTCLVLPEGTAGDSFVNTVQCRMNQVQLAKQTDELDYCRRAGPGGDGQCGTNCEGFCSVIVPVCGPEWYKDVDTCLAECSTVPDYHNYTVPAPQEDSIQCRLYHATSATVSTEHCSHAAGVIKCVAQPGG
jgi:hypothetical protein